MRAFYQSAAGKTTVREYVASPVDFRLFFTDYAAL